MRLTERTREFIQKFGLLLIICTDLSLLFMCVYVTVADNK